MDALIPLLTVFAIFIPALLLPGPDSVAIVRTSLAHGAAAGLMTTLGVTTGQALYATLSVVGLSALLSELEWLATAVRLLGGAYLVWLGIKLIRTPAGALDVDAPPPPRGRSFLFGFLVNLTNPKAIVLFASIFATAVTPTTPSWVLAAMVGVVAASCLAWYTAVSLFMSAPPILRRFSALRHWIERVAGATFVAIGVKVMGDARSPVSS